MTNFPALYFCQPINIVLLITVEPKLAASKNWLLFIPLSVLAAGYYQSDLFLLHQSVYYQAMQQVMWSVLVASHVIFLQQFFNVCLCTCYRSYDLFYCIHLCIIWQHCSFAGHMICPNVFFLYYQALQQVIWSVLSSNLLVMWFILMHYWCIISLHRRSHDLYFHHHFVTGHVTFVISLTVYYIVARWTGTQILKSFCLEILIKVKFKKEVELWYWYTHNINNNYVSFG